MRTSMAIASALLIVSLALGLWCAQASDEISARYVSAAAEIRTLAQAGSWQRAEETAQAYLESWRETAAWLHVILNHEETEALTLALRRAKASVSERDGAGCVQACVELEEEAVRIGDLHRLSWNSVW